MRICVVSPSYPTPKTIVFVFVDQLCRMFADLGETVTVIAPQSLTRCIIRREPISKVRSVITTIQGNNIELYRPLYMSFGNGRLKRYTKMAYDKAVKKAFRRLNYKPDVCYGHFWSSISAIFPEAKRFNIPLFGASGEECVALYDHYSAEQKLELQNYLSGIINVSTKNRAECLSLGLISEEKSIVIPNAVDLSLFNKNEDKDISLKDQIQPNDFVVAFVGQFVPRKGTMRLSQALNKLHDNAIKAIFIGSGVEVPDYKGIIYKGRVSHDDIPAYLKLADVFVLPTENEGCSNAIVEAMACGLPIISTDASFNYDILNDSNSIMIDCHNIDQIATAIKTLKNDKVYRQQLSEGALSTAKKLSIEKRAERIIQYIKQQIAYDR